MKLEELILALALEGLRQATAYTQIVHQARAEGRTVGDADIDSLGELGARIRQAARDEADRQRAELAIQAHDTSR